MAMPSNDHHVHSDGYTSEKGDPDMGRLMDDVADDIEQLDGVQDSLPDEDFDGPFIDVDHDGKTDTEHTIEDVAREYDCRVLTVTDYLCEVRPE